MNYRRRCPRKKCGWYGEEVDAVWRGKLRCPWCGEAVVPDERSFWRRWYDRLEAWLKDRS